MEDICIFSVLFFQNVLTTNNPILCVPCTDALQESYEFKTACVEVETYLEDYISPLKKVDLKEVVANKMFSGEVKKELTEIKEENRICRLCLGLIEDKVFKEFGVIEENILQKCVPEMVRKPRFLIKCLDAHSFRTWPSRTTPSPARPAWGTCTASSTS